MATLKRRGKSLNTVKSKPFQCLICSKVYRDYKALQYHTNLHTGENPYECQNCDAAFPYFSNLQRHRNLIHLKKRYDCNICKASYAGNQDLRSHMDRIHYGKKYICGECRTQYSSHATLSRHQNGGTCNGIKKNLCPGKVKSYQDKRLKGVYQTVTKEEKASTNRKLLGTRHEAKFFGISKNLLRRQCLICSKNFQGYSALEVHMNQHTGEQPFECTKCSDTFTDHRYFWRHVDVVHHGKKWICGDCNTEYHSQDTLNRHQGGGYCSSGTKKIVHVSESKKKLKGGNIKQINKITGKVIRKTKNLKVEQKSSPRKESIKKCSKINLMNEHTVKINGAKKFNGKSIGKGKITLENKSGNMPERRKTELIFDRKPNFPRKTVYKCSQCPTTHLDRNLALRHAADCHDRKLFECSICPNLYTDHSNLIRHMKTSHGNVKKYELVRKRNNSCDKCDLKFTSFSLLWMHKKKTHNLKLFKCPYCPNEYTDSSNMMRHRKSHIFTQNNHTIRLPKVYEIESAKKEKKLVPLLTENVKKEDKVYDFPVIVGRNENGISGKSCSEGHQTHTKIMEIVKQLRFKTEQNFHKDVSFFLHLNRYDPNSI